jgi:hypothetical protein
MNTQYFKVLLSLYGYLSLIFEGVVSISFLYLIEEVFEGLVATILGYKLIKLLALLYHL